MEQPREIDVFVAGGGLSGALFVANLLHGGEVVSVALADRGGDFFRGVAYGTPSAAHLLNVPAGKMSAFAADPDHFLRWIRERRPETGPADFPARRDYGEYLGAVVDDAALGAMRGSWLRLIPSPVAWAKRARGGFLVHAGGETFLARTLVLATGNGAPRVPAGVSPDLGSAFAADPWSPDALAGLPTDAPVFVIGTGLTCVDVMLRLRELGHTGIVHAVSRRGLLPRAHAEEPSPPVPPPESRPRSLRGLLRHLRAHALVHGWRETVDGFRAHTASAWRAMPLADRERFLRHVRPWWDAHRHRLAPEIARVVERELAGRTLRVSAGQLLSAIPFGDGALVRFRERGSGVLHSFPVARVVNATGPSDDLRGDCDPLLATLRDEGWLAPDPLGLGASCDGEGRVRDVHGRVQDDLLALGPLRRGERWESTAVPELREQARLAAELVVAPARVAANVPA